LELIADAFGSGTVQLAGDANETFTIADGAANDARSFYLVVTSAGSLTATRTVTLAPNTVNKVWLIKNSTTGGQDIAISQGSGGNVTIANGETKFVYADGAGSGAAVADMLAGLSVSGALNVDGAVTLDSTLDVTGQATLADLTASGTVSLNGVPTDSTTITAGAGLTGGGDLSTNRTINVGAGTGITVNADDVALDTSSTRNTDHASVSITAGNGLSGGGNLTTSRSLAVGAGTGISVGSTTVGLDTSSSRNTDHNSVSINAGTALSGGGTIASSRTINWTGTSTDAVGQTIFGAPLNTTTYKKGDTISGTALSYCNAAGTTYQSPPNTIVVPGPGTWRCTGYCVGAGLVTSPGTAAVTTWIRIS
jgi:hypothetical protein